MEFNIRFIDRSADVFLFNYEFQERDIVCFELVCLVVFEIVAKHVQCPAVGRCVSLKLGVILIYTLETYEPFHIVDLSNGILITFHDLEICLTIASGSFKRMPCIPLISSVCTEVHLELSSFKLLDTRLSENTIVFQDRDVDTFEVRKCILVVVSTRTIECIFQFISRLDLNLDFGIFLIDSIFLAVKLRCPCLVDIVDGRCCALQRNDHFVGSVSVIRKFSLLYNCFLIGLKHLK